MKNPIFLEYYSHLNCNCYKVLLPYSRYGQEKIVLCTESEGIEEAKKLALQVLTENLKKALKVCV